MKAYRIPEAHKAMLAEWREQYRAAAQKIAVDGGALIERHTGIKPLSVLVGDVPHFKADVEHIPSWLRRTDGTTFRPLQNTKQGRAMVKEWRENIPTDLGPYASASRIAFQLGLMADPRQWLGGAVRIRYQTEIIGGDEFLVDAGDIPEAALISAGYEPVDMVPEVSA
ncbi:hypothetical protein [Desulfarculus baarsii]